VPTTADLLDEHADAARVCLIQFRSYGAARFEGAIATVRCREDNVLVREQASRRGDGRVLVIDGAGSMRCALLGDSIAELARGNGWVGIVVNGCVRDIAALDELGLGVKALGSNPRPSRKGGEGEVDVPVSFGGITFGPGERLVSDEDGIIVLPA